MLPSALPRRRHWEGSASGLSWSAVARVFVLAVRGTRFRQYISRRAVGTAEPVRRGLISDSHSLSEMGDLMSVLRKLSRFTFIVGLFFAGTGVIFAQTEQTVVAEVGGVKVTLSELEQEESAKLLAAHYQYYQAQSKALE